MAKQKTRRARRFRTEASELANIMNVAVNYGRSKSPARLARECKTTEARIYYWANTLRKRGVKIPPMPRRSVYHKALVQLSKEHPDLLDGRVKSGLMAE